MKSRPIKIIGWVFGVLLIIGLWLFFGPDKLGGSMTYSITSGVSMEPLLSKNDLALVRAQQSYQVGDIVLYHSPTLHKPVLHRIIVIQNGNYFFKGDNNEFVDPGYATRDELVGKLWFSMPQVGGVLGWAGRPLHAALLAGVAVILLVATGITVRHRRKRRGKPPRHLHHATKAHSPVASHDKSLAKALEPTPPTQEELLPLHTIGPPSTAALFFITLSLAILCLILGFSRPERQIAPLEGAYQQRGMFSYSAPVKVPTTVYPRGVVKTGDPVYTSLVDSFTIRFNYQFSSKLPHNIKGTTELRALLLSKTDTWQELRVLQPKTAFTGDTAIINWESSLTALYNIINTVSAQTGSTSTSYTANIMPIIKITGTVDGKPISNRFAPVLPFTIGQSVITISDTATPPPPGATYVPPSSDVTRATTLNPSQAGSIPHLTDNTVNVAKYTVSVPLLRWLGMALVAVTCAIGIVHDILRRRQQLLSREELTAEHYEDLLVPVTSLETPEGVTVVEVANFKRLAELAQYLERPILYKPDGKQLKYVVDDGTNHYTFYRESNGATTYSAYSERPFSSMSNRSSYLKRYQSRIPLWILTGLIILAIIATLVNTLTAGNTVPASRVGRSVNARTVPQVMPVKCSPLNLTSIVFKSAGSSSNTTSNALIIGTSGVETLNDTGNNNCIVGGGGADRITTRATSICVIGTNASATYTNCTKK